jgi:hypothetical protein
MTWLQHHPSHSDFVDASRMFLKITGTQQIQEKRPLGRHRTLYGDTKMNLREIRFGAMDWVQLAWGNVHLHSLWIRPWNLVHTMRELLDKLSNYQVLIVDVIYQAYHTRGVKTYSWQLFFLVFQYLFNISESKNCRFCNNYSFYVLFLYDEPFWENKNTFVLLMWAVCWSD